MTPHSPARFYPQRMPGNAFLVRGVSFTSIGEIVCKPVGTDNVEVYPLARTRVLNQERFLDFARACIDSADSLHVLLVIPAGKIKKEAILWLRSDCTLNQMLAEAGISAP